MTKPRKNEQIEQTKRIMERLVKMPHKPHDESKLSNKTKPKRRERSDKKPDRSPAR